MQSFWKSWILKSFCHDKDSFCTICFLTAPDYAFLSVSIASLEHAVGDTEVSGWQDNILLKAVLVSFVYWEIKASAKILVSSVQESLMFNTVSLYK